MCLFPTHTWMLPVTEADASEPATCAKLNSSSAAWNWGEEEEERSERQTERERQGHTGAGNRERHTQVEACTVSKECWARSDLRERHLTRSASCNLVVAADLPESDNVSKLSMLSFAESIDARVARHDRVVLSTGELSGDDEGC